MITSVQQDGHGGYILNGGQMSVPATADERNAEFRDVQTWIAEGKPVLPAPTPPTEAEILAGLRIAAQTLIDGERGPLGKALRGLASMVRKEVNRLRQNPTQTFPAVSAAAFIAAWKAEIAAGEAD